MAKWNQKREKGHPSLFNCLIMNSLHKFRSNYESCTNIGNQLLIRYVVLFYIFDIFYIGVDVFAQPRAGSCHVILENCQLRLTFFGSTFNDES